MTTALKNCDFRDLRGLEELDLSGNAITSMSDDLFIDLDSLVELDVSGNGLTGLPWISGLTKLNFLDVSENAFVYADEVDGVREWFFPDLTGLTALTRLD